VVRVNFAVDYDRKLLLYKHLKEPMDDILLDHMYSCRRVKREIRNLYDYIDCSDFEKSECNMRRYRLFCKLVTEDPIKALELLKTITVFPHGSTKVNCLLRVLHNVHRNPVDYIKVFAQLHSNGEYEALEKEIDFLNNGMNDTYDTLQIVLKWTLKTDDLRLFQRIRFSHYISPAHARAEGGQTIAKALET
jgi:hypothetical protein